MTILGRGRYFELIAHKGWEYIRRRKGRGVVVIVTITEDDCLVFVEQYRHPIRRRVIEYPAGVIADEHEETVRQAACRELIEEAGFRPTYLRRMFSGPSSSGSSSEWLYFYLALKAKRIREGGGVDDEAITVHEVPRGDAASWLKQMMKRGRAVDPKIYAGLYMIRDYNTSSHNS